MGQKLPPNASNAYRSPKHAYCIKFLKFIKYSIPLPSSAAVERVLSTTSDILRPKSTALAKLVILNGEYLPIGVPHLQWHGEAANER